MYCHSFFVSWVRGIALVPTTARRAASVCIGLMNAALGLRFAPHRFAVFRDAFLALLRPPFLPPFFFVAMRSPGVGERSCCFAYEKQGWSLLRRANSKKLHRERNRQLLRR